MSKFSVFKIKIDRDSIRENPNAGRTEYLVPGHSEIVARTKIYGKITPDEIEKTLKGIGYIGTLKTFDDYTEVDIVFWSGEDAERINGYFSSFDGIRVEGLVEYISNARIVHGVNPAPMYLYSYGSGDVVCDECGASFDYKKLKADCFPEGDEVWSNRICPHCGKRDCCELEFEDIEDAVEDIKGG